MNTAKTKAVASGVVAAITSFIGWLATVPPEVQSGILAGLVDAVPVEWRPTVGLWARLFTFFSTVYMAYSASHSGPQTPPRNDPV